MDRNTWNEIKQIIDWAFEHPGSFDSLRLLMAGGTEGSLRSGSVGHGFEKVVAKEAKARGLHVIDYSHRRYKFDLLIQGKRTQCKYLGKGNYDIKPSRRDRKGIRRYKPSHFDVLAVGWRKASEVFFIPSSVLICSDGYLATTFDENAYQQYKDNWDVFRQKMQGTEQMLFC